MTGHTPRVAKAPGSDIGCFVAEGAKSVNSSTNKYKREPGQSQVTPFSARAGQARDVLEIRRALAVLYQPGAVVELRALDVDGKTVAGYFDDHIKLAEAATKYSGRAAGVYVILNSITPDLLARSANHITVNRQRKWHPRLGAGI